MAAHHTGGPWLAAAAPSMHGWPVVNGKGRLICRMGWLPKQPDEEADAFAAFEAEVAANARLIAAAPKLLAAAKRVLAGLNERIDAAPGDAVPVFDGIVDLHDAIGKAEAP